MVQKISGGPGETAACSAASLNSQNPSHNQLQVVSGSKHGSPCACPRAGTLVTQAPGLEQRCPCPGGAMQPPAGLRPRLKLLQRA